MYNCCKVEEGEEKPDWCKKDGGEKGDKSEDTSSDEGESSGDEKGGKKSRRMAFMDEMGEDWTNQHKKRFAKWRKNCDCRPLSDGTITTFKTCRNKNARSVICPFGVTEGGDFQHCNAEDVGAEPARVTCRAGFWNWSCKSRCPATTIQCEAMDAALVRVESEEDTIARAGWRDACWSGMDI